MGSYGTHASCPGMMTECMNDVPEVDHDGACPLGAVISLVVKVLSIKLSALVPVPASMLLSPAQLLPGASPCISVMYHTCRQEANCKDHSLPDYLYCF